MSSLDRANSEARQPIADSCASRGIIIERFRRAQATEADRPVPDVHTRQATGPRSYAADIPGAKVRPLRFIERLINRYTDFQAWPSLDGRSAG